MPRRRPHLFTVLVPAAAFVIALAVFGALKQSESLSQSRGPSGGTAAAPSTDERLRAQERAIRGGAKGAAAYAGLGNLLLLKARETEDPQFYPRAESAFRASLRADRRNADAFVGLGSLALARHDYRGGLEYGMRARRFAPGLVRPYGVIADAQVELGRYEDAGRTLQRMVDLKPNLASYSRISYFRELHGDVPGAVKAMRLAVSAGGTPDDIAYVQALLGDIELDRGRRAAAGDAYRGALQQVPDHSAAISGLARLDAEAGQFGPALQRLRRVAEELPVADHFVALGEMELAAGHLPDARRALARGRLEYRQLAAAGVNIDVELAVFEADHGDTRRAVRLARRAWEAAPSVRSADSLGWALTRDGRPAAGSRWGQRALRLGSRDTSFLFHAGMSAKAAGRDALARRLLTQALDANRQFSPLDAPRARRTLRSLTAS